MVNLERVVEHSSGPASLMDERTPRAKVLLISHNHWALLAGGVESYVAGVYDMLRDSTEFEPFVLARAGQPYSPADSQHPDVPLAMVGSDPNQYLLYTDLEDFDYYFGLSFAAGISRFVVGYIFEILESIYL